MPLDDLLRRLIREELQPLRDEVRAAIAAGRGVAGLPEFLSAEAAAALAMVRAPTVRAWVQQGRIPALRAGRLLRVRRADLEAFLSGARPSGGAVIDFEERATAILARRRKRT